MIEVPMVSTMVSLSVVRSKGFRRHFTVEMAFIPLRDVTRFRVVCFVFLFVCLFYKIHFAAGRWFLP